MELAECLRNIHRIAEIRLNDKFGVEPTLGHRVWDWQEQLAQHSDPGFAERGELSVSYLTPAHVSCAQTLRLGMQACGFDEVFIDAVGNVLGGPGGGQDGNTSGFNLRGLGSSSTLTMFDGRRVVNNEEVGSIVPDIAPLETAKSDAARCLTELARRTAASWG
jgi:hypothetical protein